jgi:ATP-binding cassette subfamily B protein
MTAGVEALLRFAGPVRGRLAVATGLALAATALELAPFYLIYRAVDALVAGTATRGELLWLAAVAAACTLARFLLWGRAMTISHVAGGEVVHHLRLRLAQHLARLPLGYFDRRRSGEIKQVMVDDSERTDLFLAHAIPELVSAVGIWLAATAWLLAVDWRMGLASISVVPVAAVAQRMSLRGSSGHLQRVNAAAGRLNASVVELLNGLPVVKVFDRAGRAGRGAREAIAGSAAAETAWSRAVLPLGTAADVLLVANIAVIVPVGLWLLSAGQITEVTLLFFFILGIGYSAPLLRFYDLAFRFSMMSYAGGVVAEVMEESTIPDSGREVALEGHDVELRGVSFAYEESTVLSDVSMVAGEGRVTALVGPSGAGKSTIARLIARFWEVDAGAILIGGVDVREMAVEQLMREVSFVFQDSFLFADTIAANIRLANPEAGDEDVRRAARAARAHEFIQALPHGYASVVGERGASLSGGQRQRVAIARAILKASPIIVLDEATAFADPDNEVAIQEAIGALTCGRTLIVVAHRLATITRADHIVVLDRGAIVERGRHPDLLAAHGLYRRLWDDATQAADHCLRPATRSQG